MRTLLPVLLCSLLVGHAYAAGETSLREADRISYSLGYELGAKFQRQKRTLDGAAFAKGVDDAQKGASPAIPEDEMADRVDAATKAVLRGEREFKKQAKEAYRGEGRAFLEANAARDGVIVLPSGLQYRVLEKGSGKTPGPADRVRVHYRGTLLNGSEIYDTHRISGGPETFHVGAVFRGMSEALQLMKEGARWKIFVPADLAFGERGALADRTLIYDLELIAVLPASTGASKGEK